MGSPSAGEPDQHRADSPHQQPSEDTPILLGPRGQVDALDATPGARPVRLALGERCWEVMLAEHHERELSEFLLRFTPHAHRVARAHYPGLDDDPVRLRDRQLAAPPPRFDAPTIRAWAHREGLQVPTRGPVPRAVKDAYREAMRR